MLVMFIVVLTAIFLRLLVMSEVKVITEKLKIIAQCNYRHLCETIFKTIFELVPRNLREKCSAGHYRA